MKAEAKRKDQSRKSSGTSRIRVWDVLGVVLFLAMSGVAFYFLREARDIARLASCRPYSVRWVTDGYSADHEGMFPRLSPTPGRLFFVEGAERPYISEFVRTDFLCEFDLQDRQRVAEVPGTPLDDWSYIYLGYVIENQAQLVLFAEEYRRVVAAGGDFTHDIKVAPGQGNCGTDTIYRLRSPDKLLKLLPCLEGKLDHIPLVIEWPENHRGPVAKVVMLDPRSRGEVMPYPDVWPMTEDAIHLLRELDALGRNAQ